METIEDPCLITRINDICKQENVTELFRVTNVARNVPTKAQAFYTFWQSKWVESDLLPLMARVFGEAAREVQVHAELGTGAAWRVGWNPLAPQRCLLKVWLRRDGNRRTGQSLSRLWDGRTGRSFSKIESPWAAPVSSSGEDHLHRCHGRSAGTLSKRPSLMDHSFGLFHWRNNCQPFGLCTSNANHP